MAIEEYLNPDHSIRKEIALFLSLIATAVNLVSFVATDWAKPDSHPETNPVRELGLWRVCRYVDPVERNREGCFTTRGMDLPGWFIATQTLCTIGFILQIITLFLVILSECSTKCRGNLTLVFTFVGTGIASTIFLTSGLVIYGQEIVTIPLGTVPDTDVTTLSPIIHTYKIAWAFYLIAAGTALQPPCAILGLWDSVVQDYTKQWVHKPLTDDPTPDAYQPYGSITNIGV